MAPLSWYLYNKAHLKATVKPILSPLLLSVFNQAHQWSRWSGCGKVLGRYVWPSLIRREHETMFFKVLSSLVTSIIMHYESHIHLSLLMSNKACTTKF